jgi:DNA-binding transcriptional LysR family regulator
VTVSSSISGFSLQLANEMWAASYSFGEYSEKPPCTFFTVEGHLSIETNGLPIWHQNCGGFSGIGAERLAVVGMSGVDTKLLRAAVVLAEELNFSRAAEKLHIGQSALTKQINSLEEFLGHELFRRDSRAVLTTPAGDSFVAEARLSLLHLERAIQLSRAANRDREVVLHIGKSPYTDPYLLTNLLSLRLPLFPNLKIQLTSKLTADSAHDLLNGTLDLAFLTGIPSTPRLSAVTVAKQSFFVAMLEEDKLAQNQEVNGHQLEDTSCILFERHVHPTLYDSLRIAAKPATKPGTTIHHIMTAEDASHFVLRGFGVAVLSQAEAWRIARNGITIRPLQVSGIVRETRLACRADSQIRVVSEFLRGFVKRIQDGSGAKQLRLGLAS